MANLHGTLIAGEAIGNYEIVEVAGSGGMGVVYRALDRRLKRTVALKFLPAQLSHSPRDRERFLHEARMASSLDHPNIGVIHAIEETTEGQGYIVMAFYEGQSLAQRIADGPLPEVQAVDIAMQMACGLSEAHARKIVHRDIKPSNVMLTGSSGDRCHVRLVDFGLAQWMAAQQTSSGGAKGTLNYMSPEQALEKPADARTDIWSLGVTLAEMLTGRNPFARETISATLLAILNDPPVPMAGIHPNLQAIVYRALSKDVTARYQEMAEIFADLKQLQPLLPAAADAASGSLTQALPEGNAKPSGRLLPPVDLRKALKRASKSALPLVQNTGRSRLLRFAWILGALTLLSALTLTITPIRERLAGIFLSSRQKHIAVLPFENLSGDPGNAPLVAGLLESLSARLSNLDAGKESLWVVPGSEVLRLKIENPQQASKLLGATLVVRGSVQKQGSLVQLTVNLVDSRKLREIGSFEVEDPAGNIASLETQAVERLARLMNLKVRDEPTPTTAPSSAPGAYESYLTGLGYLQRYDKVGNVDSAIAAFQRSIALDPKFAVSYAQLGEAFRTKSEVSKDPQWVVQAEANCRKAIELNPELASAYVTLGRLHSRRQQELALQEYQHALTLDTHSAIAESGLASIYQRMGRMPEAEAAFQKAIALQPEDWKGYDNLGNFYETYHRYPEAFAAFKHAQQLTPDNAQVLNNLATGELDSGDPKLLPEAETLFKKSLSLNPSYQAFANLAQLYQQTGRYAAAAATTEQALAVGNHDYVVWANLINDYECLKQEDKANEARRKAIVATESAVQEDPRDATAHALLADEYARTGRTEQALEHIQTAQALGPDDPVVLADTADAYEGLGDRRDALAAVRKAMQKGFTLDQLKSDVEAQGLVDSLSAKH